MTDSNLLERLADEKQRNRAQRLSAIKRWVRYIENHPPEVWGPQQNALIDSQLRSARESGLDADHYRHIDQASRDR